MSYLDHIKATNDQIISFCSSPNREIIGGLIEGNFVVKLSENVVVKIGMSVKIEEAINQIMVRDFFDSDTIRVLRVYRYFFRENLGYIVMEFMKGRVIDPLEDPYLVKRIASVSAYLGQTHAQRPGPLGGGVSRGLLWPDNEEIVFSTIQKIEKFLNSRLSRGESAVSLSNFELILCHFDIAPRNILWLDNETICLLN